MKNLIRRLRNLDGLWCLALIVLGFGTAAIGTSIGMLIYDLYQLFH